MATKPFVTVSLILHDVDSPVELADYINDDGQFVNLGTQTAAAIARREAVHFSDHGAEVIIPFHAISTVTVSKESGEYTKPDDDFCQPMEEPKTNYTVTWVEIGSRDDIVLGTEIYEVGEVPSYKGDAPTQGGYTFIGWNSDRDAALAGTALSELPPVDGTVTYYAVFTPENDNDNDAEQ